MVFADKVIDRSGIPAVWITEELDSDPEDRGPETVRVVWTVSRVNCGTVLVRAKAVHEIQDGVRRGKTHDIPAGVPDDHLEELRMEIQLDIIDNSSREQEIIYSQFDIEDQADPEPVEA